MAQGKNHYLCAMFIRNKKNRSGSTSVVVVNKINGRYKEIKNFGTVSTEEDIQSLDMKPTSGYVHTEGN